MLSSALVGDIVETRIDRHRGRIGALGGGYDDAHAGDAVVGRERPTHLDVRQRGKPSVGHLGAAGTSSIDLIHHTRRGVEGGREGAGGVRDRHLIDQRAEIEDVVGGDDAIGEEVALGESAEHGGRLAILDFLSATLLYDLEIDARRLEQHKLVLAHVGHRVLIEKLAFGDDRHAAVVEILADGSVLSLALVSIGLVIAARRPKQSCEREEEKKRFLHRNLLRSIISYCKVIANRLFHHKTTPIFSYF